MCDCYSMICKCRKFYVPIHITDFAYPREIIKQAYCPYCNYLGPKADKKEYQTNTRLSPIRKKHEQIKAVAGIFCITY